jgi:hypothetical protein
MTCSNGSGRIETPVISADKLVLLALLRVGAGTAAVAGLGHFPMSRIPAQLRRFLFGEKNDTGH